MTARRVPALALPVDTKAGVVFLRYQYRTPLLTIATGHSVLLVTLTLPEQLEAGHVEFARQLAAKAWAYAVAVERRYRGLPSLPDAPTPFTLDRQGRGCAGGRPGPGGSGAMPGRRSRHDRPPARRSGSKPNGVAQVASFMHG